MKEIDNNIIKSAIKKDKQAFEKLYVHYKDYVWMIVFRTVNGDMTDATNILQDVFVKVNYKLSSFSFKSNFSTWLFRITYTTSMSYLKKQKIWWKRNTLFTGNEASIKITPYGEVSNKNMVQKILRDLTPQERFLLVSKEVNGMSFEEIEIITKIRSGTLRTQLHRLKDKIKQEFKNEY